MDAQATPGIAGRIAAAFLHNRLTPLLALTGLLLGLFAVLVTPREEEPQISVTFANVFIPYPGASAREVEALVTTPAEQIAAEIEGVEHVYSVSRPGMAALTVQFLVGEPRTEAIVRLYNAFHANRDWAPAAAGVGFPLIKPKGIDDVPVVAATLWSSDPGISADDLLRVARTVGSELQRVPGTRDIDILGGPERVVHVVVDAQRLAGHGLAPADMRRALAVADISREAGRVVQDNREILVQAGELLMQPEDVADLVVGVRNGAPVLLRDVAEVRLGTDLPERYVTFGVGPQASVKGLPRMPPQPAVTIQVAKKPGENAVEVSAQLLERFEQLRGVQVPDGVQMTVTRNYGATAADKAGTLIKKLLFATLSVVVLVLLALGRREALVVGAAVVVTLAMTLFASWAWGFTLNRVSLFALIFSIGILVDDAIVVVENIHRHRVLGGKPLSEAIPLAVDEVGAPTILATFTVIAALLPMAFVSGLMGPYMRPIPINAATGMLISLLVAFVFTPWLYRRFFLRDEQEGEVQQRAAHEGHGAGRLHALFRRLMTPFLNGAAGAGKRWRMLWVLLALIAFSLALVGGGAVVLKMLPFDNKSEFQVLVDMPEGTPLEQTQRVLDALAERIAGVPEVTDYQTYAGTAAPINFNGLVRQYYLRGEAHQGDIQVNLVDKSLRDRQSHAIAGSLRAPLQEIARRYNATVTVVEVPPGPPVLAPLVAEIYGLDYARQLEVAGAVREVFAATPDVVDIDDSREAAQEKWLFAVDRARAARLGVAQEDIVGALAMLLSGEDVAFLHDVQARHPIPLRLELAEGDKADVETLLGVRLRANAGGQPGALVPLSEFVRLERGAREQSIHHKDLLPVVYVTGDVAGAGDSPLYGLAGIAATLADTPVGGEIVSQHFITQPENPYVASLKWDGEWQITYETFRDMGLAYSVGLVLIYLLVVAQFGSYGLPLIIMAPIPLTMIGIMPGHALLGQQFTAPSMIGMIALAGIIVRNSILLVDFIRQQLRAGVALQEATINAAAVRAKPIALTALAAMLGGFFIIDDPIFGGLAVSLIFGLLVSTLLTLLVIPVVYYHYHWRAEAELAGDATAARYAEA